MTRKTPGPRADGANDGPDDGELLSFYQLMWVIRLFEREIQLFFEQGLVRASTHLCTGQEAVSVGACSALRVGDTMTATYRGHGAVLAMGAPVEGCLAEIIGRSSGVCGGKGGSMHLTDISVGALGCFAIVGAHLPITVGAAFAARYRDEDNVSLTFFGDGATNIGAFHEALNLASVWKLPAIFVCENNLYGEYSPLASTTPIERLSDRADAFGMAKATIDGNDLLAVREAVSEARTRGIAGEGPTLIEALTYRHMGHSKADPAKYRPPGELDVWLERDPIPRFAAVLRERGVSDEDLDAAQADAAKVVRDASTRAVAAPPPSLESRLEHVY